jgi:type IV pilus assembly protein PilW
MTKRTAHRRGSSAPGSARGLSLVELMVALVLGLLVTAGLIQLFGTARLTFQTSDGSARIQENGRFAMELLKRDLRMAGTHGFCAGRIEITNHLDPACGGGVSDFFDPNRSVVGWEYAGTGVNDTYFLEEDLDPSGASSNDWTSTSDQGSLPEILEDLVVPGSDVLVVRRQEVIPGLTADPGVPNNQNQASINLLGPHGLPDDSIILVTNCATGADLFQNRSNSNASTFSGGSGSCTNPGPGNVNNVDWSASYDDSMQTFRVTAAAYYVGLNPNTGQPGLYRYELSTGTAGSLSGPEELVEGVESMQVLYGYSAAAPTGDGQSITQWARGDQVPADGWAQVLALRLALSVRSPGVADGDPTVMTYNLAGTRLAAPGDGRLRQSFSTTVALRNRLIVI